MLKPWTGRNGFRHQEWRRKCRPGDRGWSCSYTLPRNRSDRWFQNGLGYCLIGIASGVILLASVSDAADPPPPNSTQAAELEADGNNQAAIPLYDTLRPIGTITANIAPKRTDEAGKSLPLPKNAARVEMSKLAPQHHQSGYSRPWSLTTYDWEPTALYHGPLYFEETYLERFGQKVPLFQPVVSAAQFYTGLPELPYKLAAQLPWEHIYALGYDRPGNCVPFQWELLPPSISGVLFADVVITGLIYAIP